MEQSAPEHWSSLTGPVNWFRLWHPPRWTAEERQGVYALHPPGSTAMLAVQALWLSPDQLNPSERLRHIAGQFPGVRHVTNDLDPLIAEVVETLQGEALLEPTPPWWKRVFSFRRWRSWKMWAIQRAQLLLIVTLVHDNERDPELESLARMVLRSLELPGIPADPPEVFAHRVLELSRRKFPLLKVELVNDFQMEIASSRLNLANFYRAYVRSPENFEQILLPAVTTAVQVQGWGDDNTLPPLELVRDRLMPLLIPEEIWKERFPGTPGQPWVAGLVILYVIDESRSLWYVRDQLLAHWGFTLGELHEIALDNLQNYFEHQPMEITVAAPENGVPSMMIPSRSDTYNCSRLLCHEFLDKLRNVGQGNLAVGVPERDFFVAVNCHQEQMVRKVRQQIQSDYRQADHPLTCRMLLVTADGVSELIDDELVGP